MKLRFLAEVRRAIRAVTLGALLGLALRALAAGRARRGSDPAR